MNEHIIQKKISMFGPGITDKKPFHHTDIVDVFDNIRKKNFRTETLELRSIKDISSNRKYKQYNFVYVTFSGEFSYCKDSELVTHSNFVCIDLDHLKDDLHRVREIVNADVEHIVMSFVSPNGDGLKVVYLIDSTRYSQEIWYKAYSLHLSKLCNIPFSKIDSSCKNVSRACFLCYDPDAFLNMHIHDGEKRIKPIDITEGILGEVTEKKKPVPSNEPNSKPFPTPTSYVNHFDKNSEDNFFYLIKMTEDEEGQYRSPRQTWIQRLASRCNTLGMSRKMCLFYMIKHFEYHPESIRKDNPIDMQKYIIDTVKDTYQRYTDAFGTWDGGQRELITPYFPENLYGIIPDLLKRNAKLFSNLRERDIFLLGSLGVLSGCMPNLVGSYKESSDIGANLFIFVSAPPSSGKGALKFAKYLGESIHSAFINKHKEELREYKSKLQRYLTEKKKNSDIEEPEKPALKKLFIPANVSSAAIMKALYDSEGKGILFETEADTLTGALKQDWGNFSDLLRKAFHHEWVSLLRKSEGDDIEIKRPLLSMVLSGTPGQLKRLIPNSENGLFSRICFYSFSTDMEWQDVFQQGENNIAELIKKEGVHVRNIYEALLRKERFVFLFTDEQKEVFNTVFSVLDERCTQKFGPAFTASTRRLGLITFRIAMILSTIRAYEEFTLKEIIYCTEDDFCAAIYIAEVLLEHTQAIFMNFPNKSQKTDIGYRDMATILGRSKSTINRLFID